MTIPKSDGTFVLLVRDVFFFGLMVDVPGGSTTCGHGLDYSLRPFLKINLTIFIINHCEICHGCVIIYEYINIYICILINACNHVSSYWSLHYFLIYSSSS